MKKGEPDIWKLVVAIILAGGRSERIVDDGLFDTVGYERIEESQIFAVVIALSVTCY